MEKIIKDSDKYNSLVISKSIIQTHIDVHLMGMKRSGLTDENIKKLSELHRNLQTVKDQIKNAVEPIVPVVPPLEEFVCIIANVKKADAIISIRSDGHRVSVLIKRERSASEEWKEGNAYLYDCFYKAKQLMDAKISFNFVRFYTVGCVDWVQYKSMYNILNTYPKATEAILNGQFKVTTK